MDLTSEQVKAGRALLAWSQQELAEQARVANSTVADFERGSRTPVANNAQAIREALEAQGLKFMAGGVVAQALLPPVPPALKPGTLMRWVTATHLAEWAARRVAQGTFPELVSRLIYATVGPAASLVFPSDESVQHSGWDGICAVAQGTSPIPAGVSGWELGAQRTGIKGKADSDYENRTRDPLGLDPKSTVFVFVTPNRFANKAAWEKAKRAEGIWRGVRVIDADILVHWLETCPAVAQWLAEKMNRRPRGLRSLHEVWEEWSLATKPALTSEIILTDRDSESTAILKWLKGPPNAFSLKAEAPDEAIAFLHASIARLPANYRLYYESRCVVAADADVARDLVGLGTPLIIVMTGGNAGLQQRLVDDGHHVFAVATDGAEGLGARKLPRPWRFNLRMALGAAGVSEEDAYRLSRASGRSLSVLRRLMPPALNKTPAWAASSVELNAAMLAGGWNENSAVDRKIVSLLADKPYKDVEAVLSPLAAIEEGPLRRVGPVWKLTSLHDAWPLLAPTVSKSQFDRLDAAFQEVLGTPNPRFDVDKKSYFIERDGQFGDEASPVLRQGLSEAIIALGIFPDEAKALPDGALRADRTVRKLLQQADARLWWSLRDVFRELAEASPKAFLEAVEAGLEGDKPPIMSLFASDEGFLHPQEYLSDLLWSLEVLARSPDYLPRAALLLAQLDSVDPGGKMGNRPSRSLRQIFLSWTPQTYATPEQRLKVIDQIVRRYPKVGWNLLLALAPRNHDTSQPSPHPNWRDFTPDERETITWDALKKSAEEIGNRLLQHVGNDEQRWEALLGHWASFDSAWRQSAARQLTEFAGAMSDPANIESMRDTLRDLAQKHRNFSNADWAMPEADLKALDAVLALLQPTGPEEKHRWLFRANSNFLRPNVPWDELQREHLAQQRAAAEELLAVLSPKGLLDYATTVTLHHALGIAVASADVSTELKLRILEAALKDGRDAAAEVGMGLLISMASVEAEGWLNRLWEKAKQENWGDTAELRIVKALPHTPETWNRIAARSNSLEQAYWQTMPPPYQAPTDTDFGWVVTKLVDAGRSRDAMGWLGHNLNQNPPSDILIRVLHAAAATEGKGGNDTTMFSYYLGLILDHLEKDSSVAEKDLVQLEWIYFQALRYSQRPPRMLNRAIARNPEFFAQLISMIYSPDKASGVVEPEIENREQAERIATQAYNVMHDWSRVPGADDSGEIDASELEAWVKTARKLCSDAGRGEIGDQKIGEILAAAVREPDQAWPPEPVREVIETARSRHLEQGILLGVINRRGVTVRMPLDGGQLERELAERYRHDADELRFEWDRTAAVLDRIADSYEHDAKREDISAELRDLE